MTTDPEDDPTPPHGTPIPAARPESARWRRSPNEPAVPHVQGGHFETIDDSLRHAFLRARELFHSQLRNNIDYVEYSRLKPHLITLCRHWSQLAKERPEDEEIAELLREVRSYLPPGTTATRRP